MLLTNKERSTPSSSFVQLFTIYYRITSPQHQSTFLRPQLSTRNTTNQVYKSVNLKMVQGQSKSKAPRRAALPTPPLNPPSSSQFPTTNITAPPGYQWNLPSMKLKITEPVVQRSCTAHDCPLVQAGIEHNKGMFKNGGVSGQRLSVLFGYIKPSQDWRGIIKMEL